MIKIHLITIIIVIYLSSFPNTDGLAIKLNPSHISISDLCLKYPSLGFCQSLKERHENKQKSYSDTWSKLYNSSNVAIELGVGQDQENKPETFDLF
jgi:hypothetical protein